MELIHGGDVTGFRLRYGRPPLDFSASLNPFGMPASVRDAAVRAVDDSVAYPDPLCRELVAALAEKHAVPETFLFCGNGAADVIYRLVQAVKPKTAMLTAPTFAEYERALRSVDCAVRHCVLSPDDGFALRKDILLRITPEIDILFLCQPNNPTGRLIEPDLLSAILERTAATGTVLFVDECFCSFVDDPKTHSLADRAADYPNLFILDSFTKLYAMAGIRLGYGLCSDAGLVESLADAGQPWAVSSVAQAAGLAALAETDYVEKSRRAVAAAKESLLAGLDTLGVDVVGHAANYVFFRTDAFRLGVRLMDEGILIRDCGNFRGLAPGYYRVAVRLEEENALLLRAMAKALKG